MRDQSYERRSDESPTEAVVSAVARATDRDPLEMKPLGAIIDPDALNAICRSTDQEAPTVQFQYCDCLISVTPSEVRIEQ